jgi:hypothetical protein
MKAATAQQALAALRATDPAHYAPPIPTDLPEAAHVAREGFDLDAEMARLDADHPNNGRGQSANGAAGVRLREHLKSTITDDLLREFARGTLGAKRCSAQYLDALRIVLGNQADAERRGYVLEMNRRVSFAPERVLRTIIDQMQAAGITVGSVVGLGEGRSQVVQCFDNSERVPYLRDNTSSRAAAAILERTDRAQEAKDDACRDAAIANGTAKAAPVVPASITETDVPY